MKTATSNLPRRRRWASFPPKGGLASIERKRTKIKKARSSTVNAVVDELTDPYARVLHKTFDELRVAIADETKSATVKSLVDPAFLESTDAFQAFVKDVFDQTQRALFVAHAATGKAAASALDFNFDADMPHAEAYAKEYAANLVTVITDKTRDGLREIVRQSYGDKIDVPGTAKEIRSKLESDLAGFGGLTERDARALDTFRNGLVEDGETPAAVEAKTTKLADRYRRNRAEMIARTEISMASHAGQRDLWKAVGKGGLFNTETATQTWILTDDSTTCPECEELSLMDENQNVGLDGVFTTPDGDEIDGPPLHPGCRCDCILQTNSDTGDDASDSEVSDAIDEADGEADDALDESADDESDDETEKRFIVKSAFKAAIERVAKVFVGKSESPVYVRRPLLNAKEFLDWFRDQGVKNLVDESEPHVTLAYSTVPFAWSPDLALQDEIVVPAVITKYSPDQVRDDKGEWTSGAGDRELTRENPSTFVHPTTDRHLTRTEIGDTFEALMLDKAQKEVANYLGASYIERLSGPHNRQAPFDFVTNSHGIELKTISSESGSQRTKIKAEEIERKLAYARDNGLKPALIVQVVDQSTKTVKLYGYKNVASIAVAKMEPIGRYRYSTKDLTRSGLKKSAVAKYTPDNERDGPAEPGDWVIELIDGVPHVRVEDDRVAKADSRHMELLGDEGSVTLRFDDDRLRARWAEIIQMGAVWRWSSYKPHITICVDPDFDLSSVKPYLGELRFGPEEWVALDENWRSKNDERLAKGDDQPRDNLGRWTSGGVSEDLAGKYLKRSPEMNLVEGAKRDPSNPAGKLSPREFQVLREYLDDNYMRLNQPLREGGFSRWKNGVENKKAFGDDKTTESFAHAVGVMDKALEKMPSVEGTVYRIAAASASGASAALADVKPGDVIKDSGYMSASQNSVDKIMATTGGLVTRANVFYAIEATDARNVAHEYLTPHPYEKEVVFPRGSSFEITAVKKDGGNTYVRMRQRSERLAKEFNPDQPRDDHGRFGSGGTANSTARAPSVGSHASSGSVHLTVVHVTPGSAPYYEIEIEPASSYEPREAYENWKGEQVIGNPAEIEQTGSMAITSYGDGTKLMIDSVQMPGGKNVLGPKAVIDVQRALRRLFPKAEALHGHRVTGARLRAGTTEESSASVTVPLRKDLSENETSVLVSMIAKAFNPDQPRDEHGRFAGGSGNLSSRSSSAFPPRNPKGWDTLERFKGPDGYTPERKALHDEIVKNAFGTSTPVDKPTAYFMGGGPASGKSTLVDSGVIDLPSNRVMSNADDVKAQLPEYREAIAANDRNASTFVHEESADVSRRIAREARDNGHNLVIDGTGDSSYNSLASKVESLQAKGMSVEAHYVTVPTSLALQRMQDRAAKTGRYVPVAYMKDVHSVVSRIFPKAMQEGLFDKATLWDMSGHHPVKVASSVGNDFRIHHAGLWDSFVKKGSR